MLPMHASGTSMNQTHAAASQPGGHPKQAQHLLLIEDLPHCTDAQQRQKLIELLSKQSFPYLLSEVKGLIPLTRCTTIV